VPAALGIGGAVYAIGVGLSRGYATSRNGLIRDLGPGLAKNAVGRAGNAALWAAGATWLYNAGVGYVGPANERVEPGDAAPPTSKLVSSSPESRSPFEDLGQQGHRYVTDVVTPDLIQIQQVLGEPAKANRSADPIGPHRYPPRLRNGIARRTPWSEECSAMPWRLRGWRPAPAAF
jgi:hypothetical protein